MTSEQLNRAPGPTGARVIKIPPPLYFVAAFVVGRLVNRTFDWPIGDAAIRWIGIGVAAVGAAFMVGGVAGVVAHRTTIVPHRPVRTLVQTGVYALSRNPMYFGLTVLFVGLTLTTDSWWPLVTLPAAVVAVRYLVIKREEEYLSARYPDEYAVYCARVRRWI